MGKKKVMMSVTASAVIASALVYAEEAQAASYTVKPGDSLWSISQRYNTTVSQLKKWNNLSSDIIKPNQVLKVAESSSSNSSNNSTTNTNRSSSSSSNSNQSANTYTVVKGDTLSGIAAKHGISLTNLMNWNNLNTTLIFPGNKLYVSAPSSSNSNTNNNNNSSTTSNSSTKSNNASATSTNVKTYTVKSGDTLSHIAKMHGISLSDLKKWNNLTTDLIYPGNKLVVSQSETSGNANGSANNNSNNNSNNSTNNSSNTNSNQNTSQPANNSATYTVKSGDTLSKIAQAHGISLNDLKKWNNITTHLIYPGDVLVVSQSATTNSSGNSGNSNSSTNPRINVDKLIEIAKSALGTKYTWAGTTLSGGFDCSGFIYWAFNEAGYKIGRNSSEGYYNRSYITNNPQVGDLVFFENTYKQGISHMGIYIGNNQFIHAASSTGVTITNLNNSYWKKHFHSFKSFY